MKNEQIETLRFISRKLVRELGILQLDEKDSTVTPAHWHALIEIEKNPELTISTLANILLISISKASRLTGSLFNKNLITLKEGIDKREKYLYLTNQGKEAVKNINKFSEDKIRGAFNFLKEVDIKEITNAIEKYTNALQKSRLLSSDIKIAALSTSRLIRKQIVYMINEIQSNEFGIQINKNTNICIIKAENYFYYDKRYNFWYATTDAGKIIGSIGLQKINSTSAEIKKFFVIKEYRRIGVGKKLISRLLNAALEHNFHELYLGSVNILKGAHQFYQKYGFTEIEKSQLPKEFILCELDSVFYKGKTATILKKIT